MSTPAAEPQPLIVLFDGTCGFCDRSVHFILARDPQRKFRFAPVQSEIARKLMQQHQLDPENLDSMVVIDGDKAYTRSAAVLRIALELPDPWPLVGSLIFLPAEWRDSAYDYVARHRKVWFKPVDACRAPTAAQREQFLAEMQNDGGNAER
jgi:predicted DCC family thiol-disulfide oxidoreductase YuxK